MAKLFSYLPYSTGNNLEPRKKGLVIVSTGVLIISFDALLIRLAGTSNSNVIFWRGLFMFLSLSLVYYLIKRNLPFREVKRFGLPALASSVCYGLSGVLFVSAIMYTQVANVVVIISMSPLFAALLTWMFGIDRILFRTWLAIFCSIMGVVIIFQGSMGTGGMLGNIIAVIAALNIGTNLTILRNNTRMDPLPLVSLGGAIMAVLSLPFAAPLDLDLYSLAVLALMGLVQMPAALVFIGMSTRYLPSPEVSLFLLVESVCAPIWVWLFIGEVPPSLTFLGGGIVIATLCLYFWWGERDIKQNRSS